MVWRGGGEKVGRVTQSVYITYCTKNIKNLKRYHIDAEVKKVSRKFRLGCLLNIRQVNLFVNLCEICVKRNKDNTEKGNEETSLSLTQQSDVSH